MSGPGDEIAAGAEGRGHLRASHADREQVVGTLKAAFVAGMLAKDEFDLRVGQALASRTYADLAVLTADLPAGLAAARSPKPARGKGGQPLLRPGQIITGATLLYAVVWVYAMFFPHGDDGPMKLSLVFMGGLAYLSVVAIAGAVAAENRRDKRSGGQLPRGQAPGTADPAFRRLPPASPGGQLPPVDPGHRHIAEAARRRHPRPPSPVRGHCVGGALAAGTAPASG
jgi:Domain of unknown function (DUF1707)